MDISLLITCVGAYNDSGAGTGGFVCYHKGQVCTVDKMDSTGLSIFGNKVFRYVRTLHGLVGCNREGVHSFLKLSASRDVHDVLVRDNDIICVSTGTNEIHWYDHKGMLIGKWKPFGEGDAWHLNSLIEYQGDIYVSAFGKFSTHREWMGKKGKGIVFRLKEEETVMEGLTGPHHPLFIDDKLFVCDSHTNSMKIKENKDQIHSIPLGGFTRGLTFNDNYIFAGVSSNRKEPSSGNCSHIAVIDRYTFDLKTKIEIPFAEIYQIVIVEEAFAHSVCSDPAGFSPGMENERIKSLEDQVCIGEEAIARLRAQKQGKNELGRLVHRIVNKVFRLR